MNFLVQITQNLIPTLHEKPISYFDVPFNNLLFLTSFLLKVLVQITQSLVPILHKRPISYLVVPFNHWFPFIYMPIVSSHHEPTPKPCMKKLVPDINCIFQLILLLLLLAMPGWITKVCTFERLHQHSKKKNKEKEVERIVEGLYI